MGKTIKFLSTLATGALLFLCFTPSAANAVDPTPGTISSPSATSTSSPNVEPTVSPTTAPRLPGQPGKPGINSGSSITNSTAKITLYRPSDLGFPGVTSYQVEISKDNGSTWEIAVSVPSTFSGPIPLTNLTRNTTYLVRIIAVNAVGRSKASENSRLITTNVNAPDVLLNAKPTYNGSSAVIISWDPPSGNNNPNDQVEIWNKSKSGSVSLCVRTYRYKQTASCKFSANSNSLLVYTKNSGGTTLSTEFMLSEILPQTQPLADVKVLPIGLLTYQITWSVLQGNPDDLISIQRQPGLCSASAKRKVGIVICKTSSQVKNIVFSIKNPYSGAVVQQPIDTSKVPFITVVQNSGETLEKPLNLSITRTSSGALTFSGCLSKNRLSFRGLSIDGFTGANFSNLNAEIQTAYSDRAYSFYFAKRGSGELSLTTSQGTLKLAVTFCN